MKKFLIYQGIVYKNFYISDNGDIVNRKTGTVYKKHIGGTGYMTSSITIDGKSKLIKIHKALAETFISNPQKFPVVNHIDGNKLNNNLDNLEWCTYQYNAKHAYSIGLSKPNYNIKRQKEICQYTKDGIFIKSYPCVMEAARQLGNSTYNTHLVACAKGKRKSAYGFIWKYK